MRPIHFAINAHLLSPEPGYRQAGVSEYIDQIMRHLWAITPDERWTVYAPPGVTRETLNAPEHVRVRASRFQTSKPTTRILWEQAIAPAALLRDRPNILFCPLNVVPMLASCPTIVMVHDLAFLRYKLHKPAKRFYLSVLTWLSVKRASHVLTVSEFTRREVMELLHVPDYKVAAVPNGRKEDFGPVEPEVVAQFRAQNDLPPQFLLTVGTLEPRKNISTLIRAYAEAKDRLGMPLLIGGGKGWLYDEIFALVNELGLQQDVRFIGFIPREQLQLYYAAATAFVYPSLYEGFGLPLLEAMSVGTPVVTSDAGALVEVAGDAALIVPATDVPQMAEALVRISQDESLRAELRAKGLDRAQKFSWHAAAKETLHWLQLLSRL
ncbi:MAG TPA: glycosyltransferase family 1 protein [Herpetosiphonaceae bacterium]